MNMRLVVERPRLRAGTRIETGGPDQEVAHNRERVGACPTSWGCAWSLRLRSRRLRNLSPAEPRCFRLAHYGPGHFIRLPSVGDPRRPRVAMQYAQQCRGRAEQCSLSSESCTTSATPTIVRSRRGLGATRRHFATSAFLRSTPPPP